MPGVRNVNSIVSWAVLSGHGALLQGFFALLETPSSGTVRPIWGIAKTCDAPSGAMFLVAVPFRRNFPPVIRHGCASTH